MHGCNSQSEGTMFCEIPLTILRKPQESISCETFKIYSWLKRCKRRIWCTTLPEYITNNVALHIVVDIWLIIVFIDYWGILLDCNYNIPTYPGMETYTKWTTNIFIVLPVMYMVEFLVYPQVHTTRRWWCWCICKIFIVHNSVATYVWAARFGWPQWCLLNRLLRLSLDCVFGENHLEKKLWLLYKQLTVHALEPLGQQVTWGEPYYIRLKMMAGCGMCSLT